MRGKAKNRGDKVLTETGQKTDKKRNGSFSMPYILINKGVQKPAMDSSSLASAGTCSRWRNR